MQVKVVLGLYVQKTNKDNDVGWQGKLVMTRKCIVTSLLFKKYLSSNRKWVIIIDSVMNGFTEHDVRDYRLFSPMRISRQELLYMHCTVAIIMNSPRNLIVIIRCTINYDSTCGYSTTSYFIYKIKAHCYYHEACKIAITHLLLV